MALYRLVTALPPGKAYAVVTGSLGPEPIIAWTPRKGAAVLFPKSQALKLARRMRKVRVVAKLEIAA